MENECGKIYRIARQTAGLTQERWAEWIDVSPDAVRQYEAGKIMPSDEVVTRMAEVSGLTILGWWHLRQKSLIAAEILPEIEQLPLSAAVIRLLVQIKDAAPLVDDLLQIAQDNVVSEDEADVFAAIAARLGELTRAASLVIYAEGTPHV